MKINTDNLLNVILQQAEVFLLEMGEFYPFGTYINNNQEIVPMSVHSGKEYPDSIELITTFESYIQTIFSNNTCKIAALAIDVTISKHGQNYDAIEIRLFDEARNGADKLYYKYELEEKRVRFAAL